MFIRKFLDLGIAMVAAMAIAGAADAGSAERLKTMEGAFEDVFQDLQDAVINRGLVIDYIGHVDKMLERTADAAAQGKPSPYLNARYLQFCSSSLTHEAVSADPQNLAICPYLLFAFETKESPGRVSIGYREPDIGASSASQAAGDKVRALLEELVDATADGAK